MEEVHISEACSYRGYFYDESRLSGHSLYITFPEDSSQAAAAMRHAADSGLALTIQGARTGIAGGAVPKGGLILSSEKMKSALGFSAADTTLHIQAGMSFDGVTALLRQGIAPEGWDAQSKLCFNNCARKLRFPPNPTESSASLGGAFACNAKGTNALRWGSVADHVQRLTWISLSGELWHIEREQYLFDKNGCLLPDGSELRGNTLLPAGGLRFLHPSVDMDLIDFLAGSEGLLGFAAELSLRLRKLHGAVWGVIYFFEKDESALNFVESLMQWRERAREREMLSTLEYYDNSSLELVREMGSRTDALKRLPFINPRMEAAVQVELEGDNSEILEAALIEQLDLFLQSGGKEEDTWAAASPAELEKFHLLRHAVPTLINTELDKIRQRLPALHKTASDFTVPVELISKYCEIYHRDMKEEGLRGFVFGHIAEGRLHVNLLPENPDSLLRSRVVPDRWAASVIQDGGLLSSENGIGRLKRDLLFRYLPPKRLEQIRLILNAFGRSNISDDFEEGGV